AALRLAEFLRARQLTEVDVVAHSMGGVILRWAMNHCEMPRLRRAVLIASPGDGAWLAGELHRRSGPIYPLSFGRAGLQLRRGEQGLCGLAGDLAMAEMGVIAGGNGTPRGMPRFLPLPGDNDGTVMVDETISPG